MKYENVNEGMVLRPKASAEEVYAITVGKDCRVQVTEAGFYPDSPYIMVEVIEHPQEHEVGAEYEVHPRHFKRVKEEKDNA